MDFRASSFFRRARNPNHALAEISGLAHPHQSSSRPTYPLTEIIPHSLTCGRWEETSVNRCRSMFLAPNSHQLRRQPSPFSKTGHALPYSPNRISILISTFPNRTTATAVFTATFYVSKEKQSVV